MATKKLSPKQARTYKAICSLRTDNFDCKTGWIMIDGDSVILTNQMSGQPHTGQVSFTRRQFHTLIDWYQRPQSTSAPEQEPK